MLGGAAAISLLLYLNRPPSDIAEPEYVPVTVDVAAGAEAGTASAGSESNSLT